MATPTWAYDYDHQAWVDDPELYLRQLNDELDLLESDKGADYAAFINADRADAVRATRELLGRMSQLAEDGAAL